LDGFSRVAEALFKLSATKQARLMLRRENRNWQFEILCAELFLLAGNAEDIPKPTAGILPGRAHPPVHWRVKGHANETTNRHPGRDRNGRPTLYSAS
jgi:hypothetical protein